MESNIRRCGICGENYAIVDEHNNLKDTRVQMISGEIFKGDVIDNSSIVYFCPKCTKEKLVPFLNSIKANIEVHK